MAEVPIVMQYLYKSQYSLDRTMEAEHFVVFSFSEGIYIVVVA